MVTGLTAVPIGEGGLTSRLAIVDAPYVIYHIIQQLKINECCNVLLLSCKCCRPRWHVCRLTRETPNRHSFEAVTPDSSQLCGPYSMINTTFRVNCWHVPCCMHVFCVYLKCIFLYGCCQPAIVDIARRERVSF